MWSESLGCTTVVGEESDLAGAELLCTSLLVQASRAMLAHGDLRDALGTSRTRSFRQSFLVSYAHRVGERLREASAGGLQDAVEAHRGRDRSAAVGARKMSGARRGGLPGDLPPHGLAIHVGEDRQGWLAGRAAADLATLGVHRQVR